MVQNGRCLFNLHLSALNQTLSIIKSTLREHHSKQTTEHLRSAKHSHGTKYISGGATKNKGSFTSNCSKNKQHIRFFSKGKHSKYNPKQKAVLNNFKLLQLNTLPRQNNKFNLLNKKSWSLEETTDRDSSAKIMMAKRSLNPYDSQNDEILKYLTTFRLKNQVVVEAFNFLRENETIFAAKYSGKNKQGPCSVRAISFTDTSLDGYTTKGHREKSSGIRSNASSVQPQISAILTYGGSSLDDFTETRSEASFAGTEHGDPDRKYSINRFKYNGEVYDEIIKRMSMEENDIHIKENTHVGVDQFLTYQIIIKTNDSIYFIKPKDKKCFLLNKSSVSEMVAPTTTVNSAGDKINVAKFAFVELENGSALNSLSGTSKNCMDKHDSRNFFSSPGTDPYSGFTMNSGSESGESRSSETLPSVKRRRKNVNDSKVMIKSSKRVIYHLEKMSFVTCHLPYSFCNIVFYSTASTCNSDYVLQNKYFDFLKNKIKNNLRTLSNQSKGANRQIGGDQNPQNNNAILTVEYVDHFWEKNKLKDGGLMFNIEPEFYSKTFPLKFNDMSKSNDCDPSARLSHILSRPSKHDSLLSTLLDLKLRDIMSYIWNSSSRTKLPSISSSQAMPENVNEKLRKDLLKLKKQGGENTDMREIPESDNTLSPLHVCQAAEKKLFSEITLMDQGKHLIVLNQKCSNNDFETDKIVIHEKQSKSSQSGTKDDVSKDSSDIRTPKYAQNISNTETITTSNATSLCVNARSTERSEDLLYADEFSELAQLQRQIEDGSNNCVLALTPDEDTHHMKTSVIQERKPTRKRESLNVVQESNAELHTLISMIEITPCNSNDVDSRNLSQYRPSTLKSERSNTNFKSQATLSVSSNSYTGKLKSLKKKSTAGVPLNIEQIYSNVWKKQQLAHESMLERVIPEDSILSICTRSNHSVTNCSSPTFTSRSTCSQNIDCLSKEYSLTTNRTCAQSENEAVTSCCNLSVLAVVPSRCNQYSESCNLNLSRQKSKNSRKSLVFCSGKVLARSNLTVAAKTKSRFNVVESYDALASSSSDMTKLRKRKSNLDALKKLSERMGKGFRRALIVPGSKSERSQKKDKPSCHNKRKSGCRVIRHFSPQGDGNESMNSQSAGSRRFHTSEEDKFPSITCDYNNFPLSYPDRNVAAQEDPLPVTVRPKQRFRNKKRILKHKRPDSNTVILNKYEGDIAQTSQKIINKKNKSRKKCENKEDEKKGFGISRLRSDCHYNKRLLMKNFKFSEQSVGQDFPADDFANDRFLESRTGSESSLSSYKTVNSYLLHDGMKSFKQDNESDSTNETNKKSAIQTFIGPSAIDGMMNIINLFYARQKPDECSC